MRSFSQRLIYACDLAGLPALNKGRQTALANLMSVSNEAVRKWFADEAIPRREKSNELSRILRVDSAWLFMGIGEPTTVSIPHVDLALTDQFAVSALNALLISNPNMNEKILSQRAYSIARHMLKERGASHT